MSDAHVLFARDAALERRMRKQRIAQGVLMAASSLCVIILAALLIRLVIGGVSALSWDFFTNIHSPLGIRGIPGAEPSGIADALLASIIILVMTMFLAVPLGVGGAVYLTEYARENWFKRSVQNWIANLAAVPSVVYGLLGLALFVRLFQLGATMLSAALTLAILILPIIIVSTQEALKAVPVSIREASYGLGSTRWETVRYHVLPNALPGILTGNILALSRAAGETAPLLVIGLPVYVTLLGFGPMDAGTPLQVRIFFLAEDAKASAQELAAGAVIVLVAATLLLNLAAIILRQRFSRRIRW